MQENLNEIVRLNIYLTRRMYDSLKLMALLTRTSMTHISREALKEKLEILKEKQIHK